MEENALRKTFEFYKKYLAGDIMIVIFSVVGGIAANYLDILELGRIINTSLAVSIYILICLVLSFPVLLLVNVVKIAVKRSRNFKLKQLYIPPESISKQSELLALFSNQLDKLIYGQSISGLGRSFLKNVKTAPPFLSFKHSQPVISPIAEQKLTEFFMAQEFVQTNGKFIRVGKTYVVKREDTWERIAKDVYGNEKFSDNITVANPGIYLLMAGMVIKLPYIDISTSLGLSSEEIEKRYIKSQREWIEPTLEYLRKQFYLIEDEVLSLVSWIYDAAKIAAAEHSLAPVRLQRGAKREKNK